MTYQIVDKTSMKRTHLITLIEFNLSWEAWCLHPSDSTTFNKRSEVFVLNSIIRGSLIFSRPRTRLHLRISEDPVFRRIKSMLSLSRSPVVPFFMYPGL